MNLKIISFMQENEKIFLQLYTTLMGLENLREKRGDMLGDMVRALDGVCRKFEYVAVGRGGGCSCKFG